MAHDIAAQVRGYLVVFGALLVLTLATIGASYLHLPGAFAVATGVGIALMKAALVAMYFMHLKGERPMVYWPLGLTAVLFISLIAGVLMSEGDHLLGTRWDDAFTTE